MDINRSNATITYNLFNNNMLQLVVKALRHKKLISWKSVLQFKHIFTSVKKWNPTPPNGLPTLTLGNLKFHSVVFWDKNANSKKCANWAFWKPFKRSWNLNIENGFTFFIWIFKAQIVIKRMIKSQIKLAIWHPIFFE